MPSPTMKLFSLGELVDVDATGKSICDIRVAYITEIIEESDCCHVKYVIELTVEQNVSFERLQPSSVFTTVRRQQSEDSATLPSLLASSHQVVPAVSRQEAEPPATVDTSQSSLKDALKEATKWKNRNDPKSHPVYKYLHDNKNKNAGWLRKDEFKHDNNNSLEGFNSNANLDEKEKKKIIFMKFSLSGLPLHSVSLLSRAWGIDR